MYSTEQQSSLVISLAYCTPEHRLSLTNTIPHHSPPSQLRYVPLDLIHEHGAEKRLAPWNPTVQCVAVGRSESCAEVADTFLSTSLCWLGSRLLSRSGEQLYVTDRYSDHDPRPLLEIMADPSRSAPRCQARSSFLTPADEVFAQGLDMFDRLRIYGNA